MLVIHPGRVALRNDSPGWKNQLFRPIMMNRMHSVCVCVIFHQPKIHPSSESFGTGFLKITSLLGVCWSEFRVQNSHTSWHVFGKFVIHLRQLPKCDLILPQPLTSKMIMKSNKEYLRRGIMQLIPLKRVSQMMGIIRHKKASSDRDIHAFYGYT